MVTVLIGSLTPDTKFDVFCYTESLSSDPMDGVEVLATRTTVQTSCCRSVQLLTAFDQLVIPYAVTASSSSYTFSSSSFKLGLDTVPTSEIAVKVSLLSYKCSFQEDGINSTAVAVPSRIKFSKTSQSLTGSYIIRGSPGCYNLTMSAIGNLTYSGVSSQVFIKGVLQLPDPPKLSSAVFSDDGRKITVDFDSPSDRASSAVPNYLSSFSCSDLFSFYGDSSAPCIWTSTKQVVVTMISSSSITALPIVGDSITLATNKTKPICISSKKCKFSPQQSVNLLSPAKPVIPVVTLAATSTVSGCSDITIDPSLSTGQCGRSWSKITWFVSGLGDTITAADSTAIAAFLNSNYNSSTESLVVIPNSYLSTGKYTFSLRLTNFFGQRSTAQVKVTVSASLGIPGLTIAGGSSVSRFRRQAISVFAIGTAPKCGSDVSSLLSFTWRLYKGVTYLPSITSTSLDQRYFKLDPYTLDRLTAYNLVASVTLGAGSAATTTTSSIALQIGSSGVQATIEGGASRASSTRESVTLNGGNSIDLDSETASDSVLTYLWTCSEVSPSFGADCLTGNMMNTSQLVIASSQLSSIATETQYLFTLFVSNEYGDKSSATTYLTLYPVVLPAVSIKAAETKYNTDSKILLNGYIKATSVATANWNCSSLTDVSSIVLTPLTKTISITNQVAISVHDIFYSAFSHPPHTASCYRTSCLSLPTR